VAVIGAAGGGASTLLRLISGELRVDGGEIRLGAHVVNGLARAKRPLLFVTSAIDGPGRWSVEHLLVAAVRGRTLDRVDRKRELDFAVERWQLAPLLSRRLDTLSSTEATRANLARIELLKPAVLVADRLLERASPAVAPELADALYRLLRVAGTTVISAPASPAELGLTDSVVVLDGGRVAQQGAAAEVFAHPVSEAAARATGDVNVIPVVIRGSEVESVIGGWTLDGVPPFVGNGVALVRPTAFSVAGPAEESDLIFGIEEAGFAEGRWLLRGVLSGNRELRVSLPADAAIHKGRLIALRYDPRRFTLLPRDAAAPFAGVPTDVVPSLRDSR
jgi:ABC-type Fe3+/spermidine/putrescine transport system ATPase subunit